MNSSVAHGSTYAISVGTQPDGATLACSVFNATGTANGNVTTIAINCTTLPTKKVIAGYFAGPIGIAADAAGNLFVLDHPVFGGSFSSQTSMIYKVPYANGSYGTPVAIGSLAGVPQALAVDTSGDVFVSPESFGTGIVEIAFSNGSYGAPVTIASALGSPTSIAVDGAGNLYVSEFEADSNTTQVIDEIPFGNGSYGPAASKAMQSRRFNRCLNSIRSACWQTR
jgi:hypothetical protein